MQSTFRLVVFVDDVYLLLWFEVSIFVTRCDTRCVNMHFLLFSDNMSEYIKNATDLIEQGHVRVGTDVVKDPAFLVSRTLEDFVTWVDSSKIRRHVMEYNNMVSLFRKNFPLQSTLNFFSLSFFVYRETILNYEADF